MSDTLALFPDLVGSQPSEARTTGILPSQRLEDLVAAGSMQVAKSRGKVRLEGKDYVMADGDVVEFRFNV